jgi:AraC-like DNA-binding protein/mannose-6-phosphate isomerase-like protein (cupin superfamily)
MRTTRRSGFEGERIRVLPRKIAEQALASPVTSRLLVTDCGYFPAAGEHLRSRPHGAAQAIVIICTEGRGWCEMSGTRHRIGPGEALLIPQGESHVYGSEAAAPWTVWWLHVVGEDVPHLVEASSDRPVMPVLRLAHAVGLVDEAISALETDESPASLVAASGAAWHLLALLAGRRNRPQNGRPDPVALATAILQQDLGQRVSVPELASRVGLSPSHLTARFRAEVGCGPAEYHARLRMAAARELLDTTDSSVASIARHVGYSDPFYFARQFRAAHGMTASQYRERGKG